MARVKTNERREAILDAATAVFKEMSFDRASMDIIAARVGSSKATIYRYFESKEVLFKELIQRTANNNGSLMMEMVKKSGGINAGDSPNEQPIDLKGILNPEAEIKPTLIKFAVHVLTNFYTPQSLAVQRMIIGACVNPEVGRAYYENATVKSMKYIQDFFKVHISAGRMLSYDPRVMSRHFMALITAEVRQEGLYNLIDEIPLKEANEIATRSIEAFLRAYQKV